MTAVQAQFLEAVVLPVALITKVGRSHGSWSSGWYEEIPGDHVSKLEWMIYRADRKFFTVLHSYEIHLLKRYMYTLTLIWHYYAHKQIKEMYLSRALIEF